MVSIWTLQKQDKQETVGSGNWSLLTFSDLIFKHMYAVLAIMFVSLHYTCNYLGTSSCVFWNKDTLIHFVTLFISLYFCSLYKLKLHKLSIFIDKFPNQSNAVMMDIYIANTLYTELLCDIHEEVQLRQMMFHMVTLESLVILLNLYDFREHKRIVLWHFYAALKVVLISVHHSIAECCNLTHRAVIKKKEWSQWIIDDSIALLVCFCFKILF